jgi:hypothetical protein
MHSANVLLSFMLHAVRSIQRATIERYLLAAG